VRALPEQRALLQRVAGMLRQGRVAEIEAMLDAVSARPVGPFRNEALPGR